MSMLDVLHDFGLLLHYVLKILHVAAFDSHELHACLMLFHLYSMDGLVHVNHFQYLFLTHYLVNL